MAVEQVRLYLGHPKVYFGTIVVGSWGGGGGGSGGGGGGGGVDGCSAGSFIKDHRADQRKTYLRETIKHSSKEHRAQRSCRS